MKICTACSEAKPADAFYSKTAQCIPCKKAKDKGRRRYRDDRVELNTTPAARARKRRWQQANRDPFKESARLAVRRAI